jgi:hypothetical protein
LIGLQKEDVFFAPDDAAILEKLAEQSAMLKGKDGALIWAVSAHNGKKLSEYKLNTLPVWDGIIASGEKLYMAMMNGEVCCYSGKGG